MWSLLLYAGLGLVGYFVWVWARHDWDTAMKTVPGRMASWSKTTTKTGMNEQARRERVKRGLYEEDHLGRDATEVIEIAHDKQRAPSSVVVCAQHEGMALTRVASSLRPNSYQIKAQKPINCDIGSGRRHYVYELKKKARS